MATAQARITDFSDAEVSGRVARTRARMQQKGIEALLVYDEGGIIGGGSARYLMGYSHVAPPYPAYVVVGASGEPVLLFLEGMGGTAINANEIFGPKSFLAIPGGGEGARPDIPGGIATALSRVGFSKGRLGVDGANLIRYPVMEGLKTKLGPDVELVPTPRLVEWVRREKSPAELENFKKATALSKTAMDMFMEIVQPGIRQDVATAMVHQATNVQGAEQLSLIHGAGDPWLWGMGARGPLTFEQGDLVSCELNARYHGYYSQVCRTWPLGPVADERTKMFDAVKAAHDRMLNMVKPGMTPRELYIAALDEVRKRGYDWCGVRFGHGLGLTIGEGWDFADWDNEPDGPVLAPMQEGAFGVFHPFLIATGSNGRGQFNALYGDPWVLGKTGPELFYQV